MRKNLTDQRMLNSIRRKNGLFYCCVVFVNEKQTCARKDSSMFAFHRTLTYCIWHLMIGEDQHEVKHERVALPPPTKRRDHHMRKFFV